jgi:hypothetical protein
MFSTVEKPLFTAPERHPAGLLHALPRPAILALKQAFIGPDTDFL